MNRERTRLDYISRVERVKEYIFEHLDDDLGLDRLAGVAAFSHYHWHRIYRAITGETAAQTVKRLRLHRAASELIRSSDTIKSVAARAGYGSVEAFSRAFRSAYGEPPATYRERTQLSDRPSPDRKKEIGMYDVEIKNLEPLKLAAVAHYGDYIEIGRTFEALMTWATGSDVLKEAHGAAAVYYDDPAAVPEDQRRSEAGLVVTRDIGPETITGDRQVRMIEVAGGRHAVLVFKGPYEELQQPYDWLYGTWLPESGEEAADQPLHEKYLNDASKTPPAELLTEICLPLK